jgi:hypothetical protein
VPVGLLGERDVSFSSQLVFCHYAHPGSPKVAIDCHVIYNILLRQF